jgi:ubiquinone/menaquinone biosynthesis C-methylase UbiE
MISQVHEQTQAAWDRIAAGYDTFVTRTHEALAKEGLRAVGLRPGERFLDVASGSGALSIPAARMGARVTSVDISPLMLERLKARAQAEQLTVETRVMDGHVLEFDDDTFDVAGSQFGVMLFPDMPRGISELARVTKRGGRVLLTVFGAPQKVEFFQCFVAAIRTVVPEFTGPPMDPPPLPFQLQDPAKLAQELRKARLTDVHLETTSEKLEFTSGAQLWDWLINSNPIVGTVLAELRLTSEQIGRVRQAMEPIIRARAGATGRAVLTSPINIGIGTK